MKVWRMLDNAAKIFPAASSGHNTNVFRLYCELNEAVESPFLQMALDKTIEQFPIFKSVMKKGAFWYYLEESDIRPVVNIESKPPCGKIYDSDVKRLLFDVTYFKSRINLDVYHVLTDGTGAQEFLKTLVINYLCLKYGLADAGISSDFDSSVFQRADDSYMKFYEKGKNENNRLKRAYKLKGIKTANKSLKVIEGVMSSKAVLDKAHEYGVTVTAFITGVLLRAVFESMSFSDRKRPVVVSVPVNLRRFFNSSSARNFFGVIFIPYDFAKRSCELDEIIRFTDDFLKSELSEERIKLRMNSLIGVEKNAVIRAIPLVFKNIVLGNVFKFSELNETTTVSNIGKITIPEELRSYVRSFGLLVATNKIQVGVCTFDELLTVSFSSCFLDTDVEREFFRMISNMGISVEVDENFVEGQV